MGGYFHDLDRSYAINAWTKPKNGIWMVNTSQNQHPRTCRSPTPTRNRKTALLMAELWKDVVREYYGGRNWYLGTRARHT